ncbi:MAG: 3-dehydroquinate synthase [Planctomycetaceae bacterium]|nr:3-dehydroquinate synthase [Planctomycetaceae bacterium]
MQTVRVNLGPRSYDIALTTGDTTGIGPFTRAALPKAKLAFVVADANTRPHAQVIESSLQEAGFGTAIAKVPAGEESKSQTELSRLYDAMYDVAADRSTVVVAVGGGVVGDLAGFAAASYNRGLPLLMVPTTLLSMVDSSVGGKTGINHAKGKNLIGAFHQPAGVWIDTAYLDTLPEREFRSGLAEVVKYGVILDVEFFAWLEANVASVIARKPESLIHLIRRSCQLKADVVEKDEREETGLRAVLNYGHTFAHAFETVGGYGAWLHGEAVAAGMVCASRLAEKLGMIDADITRRQIALLNEFSLPTAPRPGWDTDKLIAVMRRDKKSAAGKLRFILPTRLGEVKLVGDIDEGLVRDVLEGR